MTRLVVAGGNAAGMSAASKARRRDPNLEVVVLERGPDVSYSSCGVPHLVSGDVKKPSQLLALSDEDIESRGIQVLARHTVVAMNPYTKTVVFRDPNGGKDDMPYDKLLIATGCEARNPFPGADLEGVQTIRHVGDGVRLVRALHAKAPDAVAVVGSGFLGIEMCDAFRRRGADVHLMVRGKHILSSFDQDMTDGLEAWLAENGVEVHLESEVQGFEGDKGELRTVVAAGKRLDAELAIVAVGVQPVTEFAQKGGVSTDKEGFIHVDDQMKTNLHDVWAAGDCVATRHIVTGRSVPMPLAQPANHMGRVAGDNIAGGRMCFPGVIGTAATRAFGLGFAQTGISEAEARKEGLDVALALIQSKTRAAYLPGSADMAVKLVAERDSGKLLGCQIVAPGDAALRINTAVVAIQAGLKAAKLAEMETVYAPVFGPVWDPVVVAAQQLVKEIRK